MKSTNNKKSKNEPKQFQNCVTEEIQSSYSRMLVKKAENDRHEANNTYIVNKIFNGRSFHRIKKGEEIPQGAELHYGNI